MIKTMSAIWSPQVWEPNRGPHQGWRCPQNQQGGRSRPRGCVCPGLFYLAPFLCPPSRLPMSPQAQEQQSQLGGC